MSTKDLYPYFNIKKNSEVDEYKDVFYNLLDNNISFVCCNNENLFYTINHWIHEYFKLQDIKNIKNTFELKNYSTFDIKVKILINDNFIIYTPYNSALDKYVIVDILYDFAKSVNLLDKAKKKYIIIHDFNKIHIKYHKYLIFLLKRFPCTFVLICNHKECISTQLLQNIYLLDIPIALKENIDKFWQKKTSNTSPWHRLLDNIFTLFFKKKSKKQKLQDYKKLRPMLADLYTSNISGKMIINYLIQNLETYHFPYKKYSIIFDKLCEIEYRLEVGNRYIFHIEYLILFLQDILNIH